MVVLRASYCTADVRPWSFVAMQPDFFRYTMAVETAPIFCAVAICLGTNSDGFASTLVAKLVTRVALIVAGAITANIVHAEA